MKSLSDFLNSGSASQQNKKKIVMYVTALTAVLLVIVLMVMSVSAIVYKVKANKTPVDDGNAGGDGVKVPANYMQTTFSETQKYQGDLILVNESYLSGAVPEGLKDIKSGRPALDGGVLLYSVNGTFSLTQTALDAFNNMVKAFYGDKTPDGNLYVMKAYSEGAAPIYLSGRTVELGYLDASETKQPSIEGVSDYQWIYDHAHEYGFIQLYPKDSTESGSTSTQSKGNIFRYVGVAHATYMKDRSLTLDAYLSQLAKTSVNKPLSLTADGVSYRVYYIAPDAEHIVPDPDKSKYTYTVSGDNMGGYIVTVTTTTAKR